MTLRAFAGVPVFFRYAGFIDRIVSQRTHGPKDKHRRTLEFTFS